MVGVEITLYQPVLHLLARAHCGNAVHAGHDRLFDQLAVDCRADGLEKLELLRRILVLYLALLDVLLDLADVLVHQHGQDLRHVGVHVAGFFIVDEVDRRGAVVVQRQRGVVLQAVAGAIHLHGQVRHEVGLVVARLDPLVAVA